MHLVIDSRGAVRSVYQEHFDLAGLGRIEIRRASQVEPDQHGLWIADLALAGGPRLGPFVHRSQALAEEVAWLEDRGLLRDPRHA